jgi:hypothetical protein
VMSDTHGAALPPGGEQEQANQTEKNDGQGPVRQAGHQQQPGRVREQQPGPGLAQIMRPHYTLPHEIRAQPLPPRRLS